MSLFFVTHFAQLAHYPPVPWNPCQGSRLAPPLCRVYSFIQSTDKPRIAADSTVPIFDIDVGIHILRRPPPSSNQQLGFTNGRRGLDGLLTGTPLRGRSSLSCLTMTGLNEHADELVDKCWPSWLLIVEQVPNLPLWHLGESRETDLSPILSPVLSLHRSADACNKCVFVVYFFFFFIFIHLPFFCLFVSFFFFSFFLTFFVFLFYSISEDLHETIRFFHRLRFQSAVLMLPPTQE